MGFIEYRRTHFKKWQSILINMGIILSLIVFILEIFVFFSMKASGLIHVPIPLYILLRIAIPSGLNFLAVIIVSIAKRSKKIAVPKKNYYVSFMALIICASVSIFHSYFNVLLFASLFPIFVCTLFADKKLLKTISISTIPVLIIASVVFFLDPETGDPFYKMLSILCTVVSYLIGYYLAITLQQSQEDQLKYIYKDYIKQHELIKMLKIEPLTQLYNRAALDETIVHIINRANKTSTSPCLVMIDLDYFKSVNDTYGHSAGDEILVKLADIIRKNITSIRKAFRFGGEEFILIFDDADLEKVKQSVEKIRTEFEQENFPFAPEKHFTLSAGIAPYKSNTSSIFWFNQADSAMYKAKTNGRNQTVIQK